MALAAMGYNSLMNANSLPPLERLGHLIQSSQLDLAWQLCQNSLQTAPQNPDLQVIWGYLNLEKGQIQTAKKAFENALHLGAEDPKLACFLANACRALADWPGVIHWEKAYFERAPQELDSLLRQAEAYLFLNQPAEGLTCLHKAIELYVKRGAFTQAEQILTTALQIFPRQRDLLFLKAQLLLQAGQSPAAQALMADLSPARPFSEAEIMDAVVETTLIYPFELEHHLAQLQYLLKQGVLPTAFESLQDDWQRLADSLKHFPCFQPQKITGPNVGLLKRPYFLPNLPTFPHLLHPDLPIAAIESAFLAQTSGIVVLEPLLRPEVLDALYTYCLCASLWQQAYATGYLGCSWREGFHPPILFQLAEELQQTFPRIFQAHRLTNLWAFKCDQRGRGTGVHGDEAALNLNLWVTPTAANLNPEAGGLIIYDQAAPAEWSFNQYNHSDQIPQIYDFLKRSQAIPHRVAYRQNRAVLFSSDLFHEADQLVFEPGFVNMRLNITLLFGIRQKPIET